MAKKNQALNDPDFVLLAWFCSHYRFTKVVKDMKACFIKLYCLDETEDSTIIVNANNISTIRRVTYNDVLQTMIMMIGGERFGVTDTPEEIMEMIEKENAKEPAYN
jgi:hypothetical protein